MTDFDIVERFAKHFNIKVTGPYNYNTRTRKDGTPLNDFWHAETGKKGLIMDIIQEVYPYLGDRRREKADQFIEWYQQ